MARPSVPLLTLCIALAGCAPSRGGGGGHSGGDLGSSTCGTDADQAGCPCPGAGATRACYDGPAATRGVGACQDGQQACSTGGEFFSWEACTGATLPATEVCTGGGDEDCDGLIDCQDPDCAGQSACALECQPGAVAPCYTGPAGTSGVGQCKPGTKSCDTTGHWGGCMGEVAPGSGENVLAGNCTDGIDNDCNGLTDCQELGCLLFGGCSPTVCTAGDTRACYTGPGGTSGVGVCHGGTQSCASDGKSWGACMGQVVPSSESAACSDGKDNDCNGKTDCADPACAPAPACCTPSSGGSVDETLWANSPTDLYKIDPTTFAVTHVGAFGGGVTDMTDIALTPAGALYGISFSTLYTIDKTTGRATAIASIGSGENGLTFLTNGQLLAASGVGDVTRLDPTSGAGTSVGSYGNGLGSSGDLVAVGPVMYGISATTAGGGDASTNNVLLTVDPASGKATVVGPIGFGNVWGLAYVNAKVIGFTNTGQILQIDPLTGKGTLLQTTSIAFWGAGMSPSVPVNSCP